MACPPIGENKFLSVPEDGFDDVDLAKYQKDCGFLKHPDNNKSCVPEDGFDDVEFANYLRRSYSLPTALASRVSSMMGKVRTSCSLIRSTMASSDEFSDDTNVVDYMETAYSLLHHVSSGWDDIQNIVTGGTDDGWYPVSPLVKSPALCLGTVFVSAQSISIGRSPLMHAMSPCQMSVPSFCCDATNMLASNIIAGTTRSETYDAGDRPIAPSSERAGTPVAATVSTPRVKEQRMEASEETTSKTTLMLCNIPGHYSRRMVMDMLESEGFAEHVELIYVPMNLRKVSNFGYAFVSFDSAYITLQCKEKLQGFSAWNDPSEKRIEIEWSDLQGLEANIERYRNSPIMHESVQDELKPALFKRGVRTAFPEPTKHIRAPRLRRSSDQSSQNNQSTNSV